MKRNSGGQRGGADGIENEGFLLGPGDDVFLYLMGHGLFGLDQIVDLHQGLLAERVDFLPSTLAAPSLLNASACRIASLNGLAISPSMAANCATMT